METALKSYLYSKNTSYWQKQSMIAWQIMKMVFLWKDEELKNQEELLTKIFWLSKNNLFNLKIKIYSKKQIAKNLFNLFYKELWKLNLTKDEIKELILKLLKDENEDIKQMVENLSYINILIYWSYEYLSVILSKLSKKYNNITNEWKRFIFWEINNYLKNFMFFTDFVYWKIKNENLTPLYKDLNKYELNWWKFIKKFLLNLKDTNEKKYKDVIKYIKEWFNFSYKEIVLNSFLTQTDLSNSLELMQDVFQKFLRYDWEIQFDDMYITKIDANMLRFNKKFKNKINLKNISLFWLIKN